MKIIKWLKEQEKRLLVKTTKPKSIYKIEGIKKKDTFRRDTKKAINTLADNQKLMNDNQTLDRERLKRLDEKLTEITKMLMGA